MYALTAQRFLPPPGLVRKLTCLWVGTREGRRLLVKRGEKTANVVDRKVNIFALVCIRRWERRAPARRQVMLHFGRSGARRSQEPARQRN